MSRSLRRLLPAAMLAAALALPFFWRLDAEEFHGDESHWITSGQQAVYLLTSGHLRDPQWRDEFYLYSQPQVGKLLIGAALAVAGYRGPTTIYDYDWQLRPWENRAVGRVPADGAVLAARVPGAVAGWLGSLLLWALGRDLGWPRAGSLAALLLASHPLWLANARRAGLDAPALSLGLLAAWAAIRAARPRAAAVWWLAAGAALGLAAGAKYVGLLPLPVALYASVLARGHRRWRWPALAGGSALLLAAAAAVFVATNPALYERPVRQLGVSVDFLVTQARYMRREFPAFASPFSVALEVFDRAVWPTGYPPVVDRSLPDALVPGSYGTPAVALGAAAAIVALASRGSRHRIALGVVAAWAATVFIALAVSVPIWWERWHLPLIPPLCLLAGMGLARISAPAWALPAAQYVSALAMEPSFLGRGFGALVASLPGAAAHLAALALTLAALVSQLPRHLGANQNTSPDGATDECNGNITRATGGRR